MPKRVSTSFSVEAWIPGGRKSSASKSGRGKVFSWLRFLFFRYRVQAAFQFAVCQAPQQDAAIPHARRQVLAIRAEPHGVDPVLGVGEGARVAAVRHAPDLDRLIRRGGGDHIVIRGESRSLDRSEEQ